MPFVKYEGVQREGPLFASIGRHHALTLSSGLVKVCLGVADHVAFSWDAEAKKIGIEAAAPAEPGAHKVRKRRAARDVCAAGFLHFAGIPHETPTRYEASITDGMIVIDLARTLPPGRTRKKE